MTNFKSYEYNKKYIKEYHAKFVKPTIRMTAEEKEIIERGATDAGKSFNRFVVDCAIDKTSKGSNKADLGIKDLAAYARSAKLTEEEYIKAAVLEKMQKQDAEYTEEVTREKF